MHINNISAEGCPEVKDWSDATYRRPTLMLRPQRKRHHLLVGQDPFSFLILGTLIPARPYHYVRPLLKTFDNGSRKYCTRSCVEKGTSNSILRSSYHIAE
ncbi:hypothetical protein NPIL_629041 [Nephila pilipes]|uniref:Uncharacterized protein n=1 Tax=Nephila pilipes TaxID=299642 RepID=A0A8X6QHC4_NEPPI|nr:hypothetical protein NPIL_629041 [Nephila pilipes]